MTLEKDWDMLDSSPWISFGDDSTDSPMEKKYAIVEELLNDFGICVAIQNDTHMEGLPVIYTIRNPIVSQQSQEQIIRSVLASEVGKDIEKRMEIRAVDADVFYKEIKYSSSPCQCAFHDCMGPVCVTKLFLSA